MMKNIGADNIHLLDVPQISDGDAFLLQHPSTAELEARAESIVQEQARRIKEAKFKALSDGRAHPRTEGKGVSPAGVWRLGRKAVRRRGRGTNFVSGE